MNPTAKLWAEREVKRQERRDIRALVIEIREKQARLAPMQKEYWDNLWRNRRMDGPQGFVMVKPNC